MPGVKGQRSGGHNAKTVRAHELAGTKRKHRHAGIRNPEPPPGFPVPPKPLRGDAKLEWNRMVTCLQLSGALSPVDAGVLYQACCMYAEIEQLVRKRRKEERAARVLEKLAQTLEPEKKADCLMEVSRMRDRAERHDVKIQRARMGLRTYHVEFGLTPASRGRVKLPDDDPEDKFAGFFEDEGKIN